jgi:DUF1365 family protein
MEPARSDTALSDAALSDTAGSGSALYDVVVRHRRAEPAHRIERRLRLAYLDLAEIDRAVAARRGWSTRPAPVWFRRRDYLDGSDRPLADAVTDLVTERLGPVATGPIRMLTQLRTLGWLFNPMTAYYGFQPDGRDLAWLVIEITNTPWHERSWYVLRGEEVRGRGTPYAKDFHVSPLLPMDLTYRTRATVPGERLALHFELHRPSTEGPPSGARGTKVFDADLTGTRVALDEPLRLGPTLRSAAQTVGVSAAIYAHAAWTRAKGAPFHRHPARTSPAGSPTGTAAPSGSPTGSASPAAPPTSAAPVPPSSPPPLSASVPHLPASVRSVLDLSASVLSVPDPPLVDPPVPAATGTHHP